MSQIKKNIIVATIGTVIEWAEFTFFAYMAAELSLVFFPMEDSLVAKLKIYFIFALSYFMRPVGALYFGHIGDKFGRRPALIGAMLLMSVATFSIGLLPAYSSIGIMAPILLMLFRLMQGFAVAGEFNGACVFIYEHYQEKPFLAGAYIPFAAALGMVLGGLSAVISSAPSTPDWTWRAVFLIGGVLGLLAIYLRRNSKETPEFIKAVNQNKIKKYPISALKDNIKGIALTIGFAFFINVLVYVGNIHFKSVCIKYSGFSSHDALKIIMFGQIVATISILIFANLADRTSGLRINLLGLFLAVVLGPVILTLAKTGNIYHAIFGQLIYGVLNGMVSATIMTFITRKFKIESRYIGSSFAWSVSAAMFGGTALILSEKLISIGYHNGPGYYISFSALVAFIVASVILKDSSKHFVGELQKS